MKSIKIKMVVYIGVTLLFVCVGLGIISYVTAANAITAQVDQTLPQLAGEGAKVVSERMNALLGTLESVANNNRIKDPNNSWEDKKNFLLEETKRSGHISMILIGIDGLSTSIITGKESNLKDRDYFQKAIAGNRAISEPIISKDDESLITLSMLC